MNGEGFAFFRYHTLRYPNAHYCLGFAALRFNPCVDEWRTLQRKEGV